MQSHAKFKAKFKLPYTLLADTEHKMAEAYDVWKQKSMFGRKYMGVERTTFLIDAAGKLRKIFPRVTPEGHAEAVEQAVKELLAP